MCSRRLFYGVTLAADLRGATPRHPARGRMGVPRTSRYPEPTVPGERCGGLTIPSAAVARSVALAQAAAARDEATERALDVATGHRRRCPVDPGRGSRSTADAPERSTSLGEIGCRAAGGWTDQTGRGPSGDARLDPCGVSRGVVHGKLSPMTVGSRPARSRGDSTACGRFKSEAPPNLPVADRFQLDDGSGAHVASMINGSPSRSQVLPP